MTQWLSVGFVMNYVLLNVAVFPVWWVNPLQRIRVCIGVLMDARKLVLSFIVFLFFFLNTRINFLQIQNNLRYLNDQINACGKLFNDFKNLDDLQSPTTSPTRPRFVNTENGSAITQRYKKLQILSKMKVLLIILLSFPFRKQE